MFVLLAATCQAEPELSPYLSFTVPGLDSAIQKIELADIDGDNFAEVLACDGHTVVLFSLPNDILFTDTLDSDYPEYEIELADVNRDSVADVLIGYFHRGYKSDTKVVCYDSTLVHRRLQDQVFYLSSMESCTGNNLVMLEAVDIDHDGYDELFLSSETSYYRIPYMWCETTGSTEIFHSYPNSTLKHLDIHTDGIWLLPERTGYPSCLTHKLTEVWSNIGPDYSRTSQGIVGLDTSGTLTFLAGAHAPYCYDEGGTWSESQLVLGSLIDSSPPLTLICSYSYSVSGCVIEPPALPSDRGIVAYHLHPNDSVTELWSHSTVDHSFTNFITHPTFPDQFFSMAGDTLMRFSATDGSLLRRYDPLPEGMKFWDYPYGEDEPYLVIVNHDTVSYHGFAVVTDVEVDSDNKLLPATFTLGQPYPNPFNPTVTLPVALNEKGHLKVEVFNPLGQQVATIYNATTSAGEFDLTWDAVKFASGVYLFRATVENQTATVKAVLLK
ncbi:MAG: T9SS type A sorting domain-containing protein [candidate division Zixibacteria bacterium]|nr:T9SS type A sorting domain-containing protein [candidate division Zixibacteria bacterium]